MAEGKKEITIEIKSVESLLVLITLIVFLYLFLQTTIPYSPVFGDEGFHVRLSEWIALYEEYPKYIPFEGTAILREGNFRPPLWNLLLASFNYIFGYSELIVKILTPLITFFTALATFVLVKRIYDSKSALISSLLLVSFQSVVTYTIFFYYAALVLLFSTLSFLSLLVYVKEGSKKFLILYALFAALAFLTNQVALVLYMLFFIYIGMNFLKEKNFYLIKEYLPALLILILLPIGFILRNFVLYQTPICSAIPYLNIIDTSNCRIDKFEEKYRFSGQAIPVGTEKTVFSFGILDYLEFAYGNIWLILLPFFVGFVIIYIKKVKELQILLIFFAFLVIIFPFVSYRAEDTARYTLIWAPIFAMVSSIFYSYLYDKVKAFNKYLPLIIIILIIYFSITSIINRTFVLSQIKSSWENFVESCKKIDKILPKDVTIYTVWGHNAAYACKRNIVSNIPDVLLSYNDINYTLSILRDHRIDYIFVQKGSIDFRNMGYAGNYPLAFVEMLENNKDNFQVIYEDGTPLQQCLQQGICNGNILYQVKF